MLKKKSTINTNLLVLIISILISTMISFSHEMRIRKCESVKDSISDIKKVEVRIVNLTKQLGG